MNSADLHSSVYLTLVLAGAFSVVFVTAFFVFCGRVLAFGMPRTARIEQEGKSIFLGKLFMEYWIWFVAPFVRWAVRIRVSPDTLTILGCVTASIAGVAFYFGNFFAGGWLVLLAGTFDILDGTVARARGITTRSGAFLDSTLDRYAELISLSGIVCYYQGTAFLPVVLLAIIGSMMVSYTRARGEGVGIIAKIGNMQRTERLLYIGLGTAFAPVVANIVEPMAAKPHYHLAMIAITIVAIFSNTTAFRRLVYILRELKPQDQKPQDPNSTPSGQ